VLHSLSFIDDPTRILRAVRFEQRFGFNLGKHTLRLIKNSLRLGILGKLSSKRLFTELKLILEEPDPRPCLKRLYALGVLQAIHPRLSFGGKEKRLFDSVYDVLAWYELLYRDEKPEKWLLYLSGLLSSLKPEQRKEAAARLGITGSRSLLLVDAPEKAWTVCRDIEQMEGAADSRLYQRLKDLKLELLLFAMAICRERVRQAISHFITNLLLVRPELKGDDLKKLGFTPGPVYRKIFDRLLAARLDKEVRDKGEEKTLVLNEFGDKRK